ncbi:alpha/beta hydrolase domain-containing protein 17C-like [Oryctolagus cuniculus]|uniref:alpha/beta hydrolase domain-containing protein 17C-like n=1 Tax=Oryctolagus cuniculus TaxID=9986 RepID=UPI0038782E21
MGISLGELRRLFYCPPCPSISSAKPAFLPPKPPTPSLCPSGEAQGHRPERPPRLQPLPLLTKERPGADPRVCSLHPSERATGGTGSARWTRPRWSSRPRPGTTRGAAGWWPARPAAAAHCSSPTQARGGPGPDVSFHVGLGSRIRCSVWDSSVYGLSPASPPEPPCRLAGAAPWAGSQSQELRPLQAEPGDCGRGALGLAGPRALVLCCPLASALRVACPDPRKTDRFLAVPAPRGFLVSSHLRVVLG